MNVLYILIKPISELAKLLLSYKLIHDAMRKPGSHHIKSESLGLEIKNDQLPCANRK